MVSVFMGKVMELFPYPAPYQLVRHTHTYTLERMPSHGHTQSCVYTQPITSMLDQRLI